MPNDLELLKSLQYLDKEIFGLRRQQVDKPRTLEQTRAEVAAQTARVKEVEERVKTFHVAQKTKEGDLQAREANVKKLQGQLFQVKTNKEYTAIQHEIETLKADNSLLESTILETLERIDQAMKERQQEQQRLAELQQKFQQEEVRVHQELGEIETQLAGLNQRRGAITPHVAQPALSTYERILQNREGIALVPLMKDSCGGCHRRLPPQVINQVYLAVSLVTCESCNRILYRGDEAEDV